MAFQLPNWFAAPQLEVPDFLGEYMKGYRASKEPAAIRRKEEEERIANALKGLELQYAPEQYQQEATKRGQDIEKMANELNVQPEMLSIALEQARRANTLGGQYDAREREADLAYKLSQADYYKRRGINEIPENLAPEGAPEGAIRMDLLPKNEQLFESKRMSSEIEFAEDLIKTNNIIERMEKIQEKNPNLSDTLTGIIIDPESSGITEKALRKFANKKDRAAIEEFSKLSNELVLHMGKSLGSKNFTDAKLKALQMSKARYTLSKDVNLNMLRELGEDTKYGQQYKKDLIKAKNGRYVIQRDFDRYKSNEESLGDTLTGSDMVEAFDEDAQKWVRITRKEAKDAGLL